MEANEIQIGDWVYSTFSKLPCKVTYLKLHESGYASVETTNVVGVKDIASLSPIPLTPEILEKNGFKKEWDEDIILMVCDNIIVEIGDMYKIYKDGKMYFHGVLAPLYCVHELQHALRLCGIEKEIVL